jgi:DNA polymerase-1
LELAWDSGRPLLFHNANFDLEVARVHLGLPYPDWSRVHDTLPMLFLRNPYADTYSLKPSAERILKMKPEERDAVLDWLITNQPMLKGGHARHPLNPHYAKAFEKESWFEEGQKVGSSPKGDHYAGAYICLAPASLVGPYCIGDVERAYKLALHVGAHLEKMEMVEAYRREIEMAPVVLDMEREGVRVDVKALVADEKLYTDALLRLDVWIRGRLKAPKDLNIDSGSELVKALLDAKLATEAGLGTTPTGQVSTAKDSLDAAINDAQLKAALRYRGVVGTCLRTYIHPWAEEAKRTGGRIYTQWNSTRREKGGDMAGARTGRLSASRLMNVPKAVTPIFGSGLAKSPIRPLPQPPFVRRYILPDEGHVLIDRDFSQQEIRILAHFEDDVMAEAYNRDPDIDQHQLAANDLGVSRKAGKVLNLAIIYGLGIGLLAEKLGCTVEEAKLIKARYFTARPSIKRVLRDITKAAKAGHPICTWGGRKYYVEDPKFLHGHYQTYEYKLCNYLIQGSAADLIKAVMIEFRRRTALAKLVARIRITVHDELAVSALKAHAAQAMKILKEVMAMKRLDVPMTSTGKVGPNWADMKAVE